MSFDLGSQDLLKALGCMVLSGPFLTGYTQVCFLVSLSLMCLVGQRFSFVALSQG